MTLSIERFAELLDAYGAGVDRWPPAQSAAARELLAQNGQAQRLLEQAQALDTLLQAPEPVAPSPWMRQRILQNLDRGRSQHGLRKGWSDLLAELGGWRLAAPSLAAALCLGVALGLGAGLEEIDQQSSDLMALLQLDQEDMDY